MRGLESIIYSTYGVGGATCWGAVCGWKGVCVCVKTKNFPWCLKVEFTAAGWTHTFYDCYSCDRWPAEFSVWQWTVKKQRCTFGIVIAWKWILPEFGNYLFFFAFSFVYSDCFIIRGYFVFFICGEMVRFARLSSWHSWDLLHGDSDIPEDDVKAKLTDCEVRLLFTRLLC